VSSAALRPPADDASIVAARRAAGVRFPAARIADEAELMCDVLASVGIDGNVGSWWHGHYVPVAQAHRRRAGRRR
jgi:hypothetical protein